MLGEGYTDVIRWGKITSIFPANFTVVSYRLLWRVRGSKLDQNAPLDVGSLSK